MSKNTINIGRLVKVIPLSIRKGEARQVAQTVSRLLRDGDTNGLTEVFQDAATELAATFAETGKFAPKDRLLASVLGVLTPEARRLFASVLEEESLWYRSASRGLQLILLGHFSNPEPEPEPDNLPDPTE